MSRASLGVRENERGHVLSFITDTTFTLRQPQDLRQNAPLWRGFTGLAAGLAALLLALITLTARETSVELVQVATFVKRG
jgi:hypothetical protein